MDALPVAERVGIPLHLKVMSGTMSDLVGVMCHALRKRIQHMAILLEMLKF
jgi:hypothetical protein